MARILGLRLQGYSLKQIGAELGISLQRVAKTIDDALNEIVVEPAEQYRKLELARLDQMWSAIYERAIAGDLACIDRLLAIQARRAKLLGLDLAVSASLNLGRNGKRGHEIDPVDGRRKVDVVIINDPEASRKTPVNGQPSDKTKTYRVTNPTHGCDVADEGGEVRH
jgi:hypothetical protein